MYTLFRPHVPAAKDIGRIICSLIVFFSILLNLNRFMEYETKVNFSTILQGVQINMRIKWRLLYCLCSVRSSHKNKVLVEF